jgi:nicotinate-nucleotide adenylyltransferase
VAGLIEALSFDLGGLMVDSTIRLPDRLTARRMRLGIFGGTFDPPHNGHLIIARAASDQLQLDRVLFAPAGVQPLKQNQRVTSAVQRATMVDLAIAGEPGFELSRIDLDRPGPHYTADLLEVASRQYPSARLWFIMGGDSLGDLLKWHAPQRLIELARLAVLWRPGFDLNWGALEAALPDLRSHLDWIDLPPIDIAAHDIQRCVREGKPIDGLVPAAVARYIAVQRLYTE